MSKPNLADTVRDIKTRVREAEGARPPEVTPMYAELERKDVRLRSDQIAGLTALARALMRSRRVKAERITENTLIRVAVDLLLAHQDQLRGATEQQLRKSVTSVVRNTAPVEVTSSRTPEVAKPRAPGAPGLGTSGMGGPR